MKLLLSNDDGVHSPGLHVLSRALSRFAEVRVIAPDRDHSGASNSLTLSRPLSLQETAEGFLAVDGTPTDCVHLGLSNAVDFTPERVVSGINSHSNLGDDVLYSGTVAAAMEGRFLPLPAIAVSLANRGHWHWDTAARVVSELLQRPNFPQLPPFSILNINVPDVPFEALRGMRITRLGYRERSEDPHRLRDPRGRQRFWLALAGEGDDAGPGTDFHAVAADYVSLTPLQADMTCHAALSDLNGWLDESL